MADIKRHGDTGIHTVEGNLAGARAGRLTKQRDAQTAEYEAAKNKIKEQNASGVGRIDDKFSAATDSLEQEFRRRTVGLVTADAFRKAKADTEEIKTGSEEQKKLQEREHEAAEKRKKDRVLKRKKMASSLSFAVDDDGEEAGNRYFHEIMHVLLKVYKSYYQWYLLLSD
jgi:protein FAM50